ncbi:hypothetical protein DFH08DRAFT_1027823 [Mycena albidolilacea]|uniref:DUF7029 domain-containing protein n=1 Tax=Mycena albidolilacea TaxID=1033008 RepID=A0AAD6ZKB5_9AGAR|nr:hypothetical protein DFH08DRAFT_1027823 [Mycena albidolilacea]
MSQPLLDVLGFGSLESRTSFLGDRIEELQGSHGQPCNQQCTLSFPLSSLHSLLILHGSVFVTSHQASSHTATEEGGGSLILYPGINIHLDDDLANLNNLKATKAASLYYKSPDDEGSVVCAASTMEVSHMYPAVSLELTKFISSVICRAAENTISLTLADKASFQTAFSDWRTHDSGFLIIPYIEGCGVGIDSYERSAELFTYTQPEKRFFFLALSLVQLLVAAKVVFKVLKFGFGVDVPFESGKGSNDAHLVFDWSKSLHPDTGVYE